VRVDFRIKYNENLFDLHKIKQPAATTLTGEDKKRTQRKKVKSS
jgi:hypothetical protein